MVNENTLYIVTKLIVLGLVIHLFILGYVFYTDYQGRSSISRAAREGCERDVESRSTNAKGWRIAQRARADDRQMSVAIKYGALAARLEEASSIDCSELYPKASLIP
jgi:hypothetical protein